MSMIDPATGLRTPINLTPIGQGQQAAFNNLFNAAGTPTFAPPTPTPAPAFAPAPAANPIPSALSATRSPGGLASRVPVGVGRQGMNVAQQLYSGASKGGVRGLASRLPSALSGGGGLLTNTSAKAVLGRAGIGGTAGLAASGLIDKLDIGGQNSNWEQGLQGAAAGAGLGTTLGLLGGPFAPITSTGGAAIGAVLGGAAGVLGNVLGLGGDGGSKERDEALKALDSALTIKGRNDLYDLANVDPATRAQFEDAVNLQMGLLRRHKDDMSDDEYTQARLELLSSLEQQVVSYSQNGGAAAVAQTPTQMTPQDIASMQMAISEFMQPHVDATQVAGQQTGDALRQLGAAPQADIAQSGANRLAHAYAAQAQMIPMMGQLQSAQSQWAQIAQQQQAQQMAGGGAGGGDFEQLLAQLGASEG